MLVSGKYAENLDPILALPAKTKESLWDTVYHLAVQIFMLIQHDVKNAILAMHKWGARHPSISPHHLTFPSKNIANPHALGICVASATKAVSKEVLKNVGKGEGFRVTEDFALNPTGGSKGNGLCFGMSGSFLATYIGNRNVGEKEAIKKAAEGMREGATPMALSMHSMYDSLLPNRVDSDILNKWRQLLDNVAFDPNDGRKNLLDTVRKFLAVPDKKALNESFKQFVLNDMELKKAQITPECYAIILDLDAHFNARENHVPPARVHEASQLGIQSAVLNRYGLKVENGEVFDGKRAEAETKLRHLPPGSYLLEMPRHTTAYVKMSDGTSAFFDPEVGTAVAASSQEDAEVVHNLLNHFFSGNDVSCSILKVVSSQ